MPVRVQCPNPDCGKTYRVAEDRLGQTGKCENCGRTFTLKALRSDTVYRAHDPVLDREVALKVPRAAALEKPEARARFLREPNAAAQLRHPHIVPVYDAGTDGEHYYIASAYTVAGLADRSSNPYSDKNFRVGRLIAPFAMDQM
jgi:hypothetical protein